MNKQHTKKQHYVSEFLLKHFSEDDNKVFVLDREKNTIFKRSVREVCVENDLYDVKWANPTEKSGYYVLDNQIENSFADKENEMASVIRSFIDDVSAGKKTIILSDGEWNLVSSFITTLFLRNPYIYKGILNDYEGVENEQGFAQMHSILDYYFRNGLPGDSKAFIDFSKRSLIFSNDIDNSPFDTEWSNIRKMKYVFWVSEEGEFVTASFPLFIDSDGKVPIRIVFPISNRVAIVLFDKKVYPLAEGCVLEIPNDVIQENVREFLKSTSKKIARFIISPDEIKLKRLRYI